MAGHDKWGMSGVVNDFTWALVLLAGQALFAAGLDTFVDLSPGRTRPRPGPRG